MQYKYQRQLIFNQILMENVTAPFEVEGHRGPMQYSVRDEIDLSRNCKNQYVRNEVTKLHVSLFSDFCISQFLLRRKQISTV